MENIVVNIPEPRVPARMREIIRELLEEEPPSGLLYHYSNLDALRRIYESRNMRASDLGFLSDPEEIRYGLNLIDRCVRERAASSSDRVEREACKSFAEAAGFQSASLRGEYCRFFGFSLSTEGDLLSQWRAYAPNQDGVSMGFSTAALTERSKAESFQFFRCRYEVKDQEDLVSRLFEKVVAEAGNHRDSPAYLTDGSEERFAWNQWVIPGVMVLAAMFKRACFAKEREWRLVGGPQALSWNSVKFRTRDRELVPYLEFGLGGPLPIERIVIGPGPNQDLRELAVKGLVDQTPEGSTAPHTSVRVVRSRITLR